MYSINPVLENALDTVNNAFIKEIGSCEELLEIGSIKRLVPKINATKYIVKTFLGRVLQLNEFILLSIYFLIARFSFLKAYKIFTDRANRKSFHDTIEKKIRDIAERQELLYGSIKTTKRASAFDVKNKEKLPLLITGVIYFFFNCSGRPRKFS